MARDNDNNNKRPGRPGRPGGRSAPSRGSRDNAGRGGGRPSGGGRDGDGRSSGKRFEGKGSGGKSFGSKSYGSKSEGDKSRDGKPQGGKSFGGKSQGGKSFGGKSFGGKSYGDKSRGSEFRGGEGRSGKPSGARGFGGKSFGRTSEGGDSTGRPFRPKWQSDARAGAGDGERPQRRFDGDRPRPASRGDERRPERADRGSYSRGRDQGEGGERRFNKPGRDFGPRKERDGERPQRRFDGDRPRPASRGDERRPERADRGSYSRGRDQGEGGERRFNKPGRDFGPRKERDGERPQRRFDGERPVRQFDKERSPRRFDDSRPPRSGGEDRGQSFRSEGEERKGAPARPRRRENWFDAPRPHRERSDVGEGARPVPRKEPKKGERIAKVIARVGLGSRRDVEAWIKEGRVTVNGRVITSPALDVTARDVITFDDAPLPEREPTRLFLYHKPRGLVTTHSDPEGRQTVFEALPADLPRVISVGRLDFNTEGLLLLTNDGGLARTLELPQTGWLRRYRVRAHGEIAQPALDALRDGVEIEGVRYGAIEATLDRDQGSNVWLTIAIREGKNREVRNILAHLGLDVNRLIRVSYGPFQLGELAEGAVEEVKPHVLREQLGESLVAKSGSVFAQEKSSKVAKEKSGREARKAQVGSEGKRAGLISDRKGRRVLVERSSPEAKDEEGDGYKPYRRPTRHYHGRNERGPGGGKRGR